MTISNIWRAITLIGSFYVRLEFASGEYCSGFYGKSVSSPHFRQLGVDDAVANLRSIFSGAFSI